MGNINKFEKVSFNQYLKDYRSVFGDDGVSDEVIKELWDNIKMPKRATKGSAGYDFYLPFAVELYPGMDIVIPTGIRCQIKDGEFLSIYSRSGLGMKSYWRPANILPVIDADYYFAENEGHIMIKIRMETTEGKSKMVGTGQAFCQGIFLKFDTTEDDSTTGVRVGGFGSTDASK